MQAPAVLEEVQTPFSGYFQPPPTVSLSEKRFCLYARKSSEDDERQALSIDSQIKEMMALAQRDGMQIVDVKMESHSAKDSGLRPIFNEVLNDIRNGKYNSILTWANDRLSRNGGDLGRLVDLMDNGKLAEIRTYSQKFTNSPNDKFLLMILGSQAKLENDNRGVNVKRGLKTRAQMGHRPCLAPLGYLNEVTVNRRGTRITIDPVRGPIIKKLFEKMAKGDTSGRKMYNWINKDMGFKTRGGKSLSLSGLYQILKNSFYYGMYEYPVGSGNWCQGSYDPLITKDIFEKVQETLKVPPRCEYRSKEFNFVRLIKCGSCSYGISAQEKFKNLVDGTRKRYVYYHCSNPIKTGCEELYIREEDLLEQLLQIVDKIDIDEMEAMKRLEIEMRKFERFSRGIFGQKLTPAKGPKVNIREYIKYALKDGSREEREEVLGCLKAKLVLKDKKLLLAV